MSVKLRRLSIDGFKTIRHLEDFEPHGMNILIGGNGAGKSNFISFFRLMQWMLAPPGQLQVYIANGGGAGRFLSDGPEATRELSASLELETERGANEYAFRLFFAAGDTFRFAEEKYRYSSFERGGKAEWIVLEPGGAEAGLSMKAEEGDMAARVIRNLIRQCVVYQFHNTAMTSRIRQRWDVNDGRYLKEDAGNLAPFLMRLRDHESMSYHRVVGTIRQAVPFFADFVLDPINGSLLLQWREIGTDLVFGSDQAADGMLRFFALVALLLQPQEDLPEVLLIDEPELGLHPHACELIASLLRSISRSRQVFVATQSTFLVDQFGPEDIVVVDRPARTTKLERLDAPSLTRWLEDFEGGRGYSLSELWEKNVLGGGPAR